MCAVRLSSRWPRMPDRYLHAMAALALTRSRPGREILSARAFSARRVYMILQPSISQRKAGTSCCIGTRNVRGSLTWLIPNDPPTR
jgi:hypothetical protein